MKTIELGREGALRKCSYPPYLSPTTSSLNARILAGILEIEYPARRFNLFCQGSSGIYVAGLIQQKLSLPCEIVYVRKHGESTHGSQDMECNTFNESHVSVFVDDFVASGCTFSRVIKSAHRSMKVIATIGRDMNIEYTLSVIERRCKDLSCLEPELLIQF